MSAGTFHAHKTQLAVAAIGIGVLVLAPSGWPRGETCPLPSQHIGLTFPVEQVEADWACRLQPIIENYTTANKIGPVRVAMPEALYVYLLDRPPLAAALINRLDLGPYKSEVRGPGRYWGSDGEGTEGIVHLVFQNRTSRIYYLEGVHRRRFLPTMSGKAVVLVRMNPVHEAQGPGTMETTIVSYTKLDNRLLSGLLSLLRPLVCSTVTRKLAKGIDVVNRLGLEMRQHPDRVLFEAMDPPAFPAADVAFLREAFVDLGLVGAQQKGAPAK